MNHPWTMVTPWFRLPPEQNPEGTGPVFQMYETSDFVNELLRDAQSYLAFDDAGDTTPSPRDGKPIRKIYLGAHHRHYVVLVELHCDVPGQPTASRQSVCEARMVVRRRKQRSALVQQRLASASVRAQAAAVAAKAVAFAPDAFQGGPSARAMRDAFLSDARREQRRVLALGKATKSTSSTSALIEEGWIAKRGSEGAWVVIGEHPDEMIEESYPLYPLVADPRNPNHAAQGRTIYFAVLPTGGKELDERDQPRYDDRSEYLVRCVVRRRGRCCKGDDRGRCGGELVWSESSELYRLASFFDIDGHSHRSVTIPMPSLASLQTAAANSPKWQEAAVGVRIESHDQALNLPFTGDASGKIVPLPASDPDANLPAATCVYPIPVLMIVATFVFKIFLVILSLIFLPLQLLASLKVCFPTGSAPVRAARPQMATPVRRP